MRQAGEDLREFLKRRRAAEEAAGRAAAPAAKAPETKAPAPARDTGSVVIDLEKLFRKTTAKPEIFWVPVPAAIAEERQGRRTAAAVGPSKDQGDRA